MNQDITVVMNQKRSRFVRAEVVVCIDTADELVFALNCNDRDLQIGEFAGGECMGPGGSAGAPSFKLEDVDAIANQIAGVKAVAPQRQQSMTVVAQGRNWSTQVIGSSNQYFILDNRQIRQGRYFEPQEEQSGAAVCVIGTTIEKEIFGSSNAVGQMLRTGQFSCRVVGVLESKGQAAIGGDQDDLVVMPIQTFQRRVSGNTRVSAILVSVDSQIDRALVTESIRLLMRERRSLSDADDDNFMILDTEEIARRVSSTTEIMTMLLGAVAAVSLVVGGIGIMNIMLVSVTERTREIGVRLAIGALEREVLMQFLIEAVVLGAMGGVLGVVIAFIGSFALAATMGVPFIFDPSINMIAFLFAALTGVIFGYFPARRAAQLDPIEAVRHE